MTSVLGRRLAATLILTAGLIHLLLFPEYYAEEPYIGGLFALSVPLSAWVAVALWRHDDAFGWTFGTLLSLGMAVGFLVSRTVGLPGFDESGEWELVGLASLAVEFGFVALAVPALSRLRGRGGARKAMA